METKITDIETKDALLAPRNAYNKLFKHHEHGQNGRVSDTLKRLDIIMMCSISMEEKRGEKGNSSHHTILCMVGIKLDSKCGLVQACI